MTFIETFLMTFIRTPENTLLTILQTLIKTFLVKELSLNKDVLHDALKADVLCYL